MSLANYDVLFGTLPRFPKYAFSHRINLAWIVMTCWKPPPSLVVTNECVDSWFWRFYAWQIRPLG